jgi:hypothetical protein
VTECRNMLLTQPPYCLEIPCFAAMFAIVVSQVSAANRSVCAWGLQSQAMCPKKTWTSHATADCLCTLQVRDV